MRQPRTGVRGFSDLAIDSNMLNMCDSLLAIVKHSQTQSPECSINIISGESNAAQTQ